MALVDTRLLRDTKDLITYYNTVPRFKRDFDQAITVFGATFRSRPLKLYVKLIVTFNPFYKPLERQIKEDPTKVRDLLEKVYSRAGGVDFRRFDEVLNQNQEVNLFPIEDRSFIEQIESEKDVTTKTKKYDKYLTEREEKEDGVSSKKQIEQAPEDRVIQETPRLREVEIPSSVKDFGSQTQITARRFGGQALGEVADMVRSGGSSLVRGGSGLVSRGAGLAGKALSGAVTRGAVAAGAGVFSAIGWPVIITVIVVIFLFFGMGFFYDNILKSSAPLAPTGEEASIPPPGGGGGSGCPDTTGNRDPLSCKYLNPSINIFETSISSEAVDKYIARYGPVFVNARKGDLGEFRNRVNYILDAAKKAGLNPIIPLGYWVSESAVGTVSTRELGCAGDTFKEQVDCTLGINDFSNPTRVPIPNCARSRDANSVACRALRDIRKTFDLTHPINYPIDTFDEFTEAHGPYEARTDGKPTNCTSTYNILVDMAKDLNVCKASGGTPGPLGFSLTCPLDPVENTSFATTCGTYDYPASNGCGHGKPPQYASCNPDIYAVCGSVDSSGFRQHGDFLKKSIDVIVPGGDSSYKSIFMPFLNGDETVTWTKKEGPTPLDQGRWGYKFIYTANYKGKEILLDLSHLNSRLVNDSSSIDSGEKLGTLFPSGVWGGAHLHTGVKVDGTPIEVQQEALMCKKG